MCMIPFLLDEKFEVIYVLFLVGQSMCCVGNFSLSINQEILYQDKITSNQVLDWVGLWSRC